jgi:hypothetical protein
VRTNQIYVFSANIERLERMKTRSGKRFAEQCMKFRNITHGQRFQRTQTISESRRIRFLVETNQFHRVRFTDAAKGDIYGIHAGSRQDTRDKAAGLGGPCCELLQPGTLEPIHAHIIQQSEDKRDK